MPYKIVDLLAISDDQWRQLEIRKVGIDLSDADMGVIKTCLQRRIEDSEKALEACYDENGNLKPADGLVANYASVAQLCADMEHEARSLLSRLQGDESEVERVVVSAAKAPEYIPGHVRQKRTHKRKKASEQRGNQISAD